MILDVDGTLIDNVPAHVDSWQAALQQAGFQIDPQAIHDHIGKGSDQFVPALVGGEPDPRLIQQIRDAHHREYRDRWLPLVQPFPGASELIRRLKQRGLWLAVATSAPADELAAHLDHLPRGCIDAVVTASDVQRTKPFPDIFLTALHRLQQHDPRIAPDNVRVVGDTPYDAQAAQTIGITCIGLLSGGFSRQDLEAAGAKRVYRDAQELAEHLDDLIDG